MEDELFHDYPLTRPGFCGRLVRVRELTSDEVRAIENMAAKTLGKDATFMEIRNETLRLGVREMIVAVSPKLPDPQRTDLHVLTEQEKLSPSGPWCFDKLFRSKDEAFLSKKYSDFHEVSKDDVEWLEGKASTVLKE